jgi:hypothetical protein
MTCFCEGGATDASCWFMSIDVEVPVVAIVDEGAVAMNEVAVVVAVVIPKDVVAGSLGFDVRVIHMDKTLAAERLRLGS